MKEEGKRWRIVIVVAALFVVFLLGLLAISLGWL